MAFSSTMLGNFAVSRSKRLSFGTFTNAAADSGGDIDTGLSACDAIFLSASTEPNSGTYNVTISAGTATVVTEDGADGYWLAIGT